MLFYRTLCLLAGILWASTALGQQNVSFTQVLEQPYNEPSRILNYGVDDSQSIAVWAAEKPTADVIFIHGGCWLSAYDIKQTYALSSALQQANYNVYSIEYRRTGATGGGWPTTYDDIQHAIDKILTLRDDGLALAVSGHSAGGHLALLLSSDARYKNHIDTVIGLAAITDVARYAAGSNSCERVTTDFMGGSPAERANQYRAANPVTKTAHPRTLLLQGTDDAIVAPDYAELIPQATITMVDGAGHFDWVHPQTEAFKTFLDTLKQVNHD